MLTRRPSARLLALALGTTVAAAGCRTQRAQTCDVCLDYPAVCQNSPPACDTCLSGTSVMPHHDAHTHSHQPHSTELRPAQPMPVHPMPHAPNNGVPVPSHVQPPNSPPAPPEPLPLEPQANFDLQTPYRTVDPTVESFHATRGAYAPVASALVNPKPPGWLKRAGRSVQTAASATWSRVTNNNRRPARSEPTFEYSNPGFPQPTPVMAEGYDGNTAFPSQRRAAGETTRLSHEVPADRPHGELIRPARPSRPGQLLPFSATEGRQLPDSSF